MSWLPAQADEPDHFAGGVDNRHAVAFQIAVGAVLVPHAPFAVVNSEMNGRTVIAISHDMGFVAESFDRIVVLRAGKVILEVGA